MHKALIVDTQPLAALLISDELTGLGFSCESVPDNQTAMSLLARDRSWNLLVTELNANAGLGGRELSRMARTLIANIRVVYVSDAAIPQSSLARNEYCLQQPYEIEELRAAVGGMLPATPQSALQAMPADEVLGQQPTGWRVDLSARQASRDGVLLGYDVAGEGRLKVTILAGGGDEETNCIIAGEAMEAIEDKIRNVRR